MSMFADHMHRVAVTPSRTRRHFPDRRSAGRELGGLLASIFDRDELERTVVIAIPRGGLPVAAEVAAQMGTPLDALFVRKLAPPTQPEYAIGAASEGGMVYVEQQAAASAGLDDRAIELLVERAFDDIDDQLRRFDRVRPGIDVDGMHAILVDDGLATGLTALVAARELRARGARTVTFAAPVCAGQSMGTLELACDRAVCIQSPPGLVAVSWWYDRFDQTTDDEVEAILTSARSDAQSAHVHNTRKGH
jgi:predicted phosphoribosyltransferase